ncbi:MAG: amino acid permease [Candidatus Aminicenantes bacterium]|nr:amino acid permease [Candidatus Aminicenantes bacterium]
MGLFESSALVIGSVIGSGIFMTSGLIAGFLPYSGLMMATWLIAGMVTMIGAICYGELGAMFPRAGGAYVFLREAYGRAPAFLYGWTFFFVIGGAGIAAIAAGFAEYFGAVFPFAENTRELITLNLPLMRIDVTAGQLIAVTATVGLTYFNGMGLRRSVHGQSVFTIVRIIILIALIAAGVSFGIKTRAANMGPLLPSAGRWPNWSAFGAGLITAFWAFDGWYAVSCTAEEIRNPRRNIPRSLALGTAAVLVLYLGVNIVYSMALPMEQMRGIVRVGEAAVSAMFEQSASGLVALAFSAVVALTIFGCLSANIFFCARVPYAMARDGLFFRSLGVLHPLRQIPSRALWAQAAVSICLILTGTFQKLIDYVLFGLVFFFAATGAAVIVLRRKAPLAERPYRLRPYPLLPLVFSAVNAAIFIALAVEHPEQAIVAAGMICSGIPAYFLWNRRRNPIRAEAEGRSGDR